MAATGRAGLLVLVLVLDDLDFSGPVVLEPELVLLLVLVLVLVEGVIAKESIVDRSGSLKPPLGAVLVAPPFSLYGGGRSEIGSGKREGRGKREEEG